MTNTNLESPTLLRRREQYADRWTDYENQAGILEISQYLPCAKMKQFEIFEPYSEEFLTRISPDVSLVRWESGSTLFEAGAFIDLAFYILEGEVEVSLEQLSSQEPADTPFFDTERTGFWRAEDIAAKSQTSTQGTVLLYASPEGGQEQSSSEIAFLSTMDYPIPASGALKLGKGEIFGEIGALSGWPQSVTARTSVECHLVQIRVAALRAMKKKSKALKERLDALYRKRSLMRQLKTTPLLRHCHDLFLESLKDKVELVSCTPDQEIAAEGEPADAVYLVRSGFVKLSQRLGQGSITVTYLSKGMVFGDVELLVEGLEGWRCTAASVEHSELVKVSREDFQELLELYPAVKKELWKSVLDRIKETGAGRADVSRSELVETALESGLVQGSSILMIDLNHCTRCDDCVRACADTHEGIPRFIREGDRYRNFLITRSCFHCQDPVCLIGCPTGAIRRSNVGDVVEIVDDICIGCQVCARACPYDAIVMHDLQELWPADAVPERLRGQPRLLASKCDLCYDKGHEPACVSNCPHGCAFRIKSVDDFFEIISAGEFHPKKQRRKESEGGRSS